MAKAPLKLDWNALLPLKDDAPSPELEVIAAAGGGGGAEAAQEEGWMLAVFSDHQIQEKIQRLLKHIASGIASKLPDKGAKLRQNLHQLQGELDRRKIVRFKEDAGECERARQSRTAESSVSRNVPSPNYTRSETRSQSSFSHCFSQKLEGKADVAFKEELRIISRDKCRSSRGNGEQMHQGRHLSRMTSQPARMSSRKSPFRCADIFANKDKDRSPNGDSRATHARRNFSSHSPKRKGASENSDSMRLRSKKVQHVVLLDEEDVQPVLGDDPDEWKEAKIYYPSRDDPESIELSYSDIKCLDPESYLSSPIMNFYIRYLYRPLSPIGRPRSEYYFFNTYFFRKLEEAMSSKGDQNAHFLKLRRWWKGVNIFQKAYIFLPIHRDLHWSLVIICIPAMEDESGPIVLHLDSLGLHTSNLVFDVVNSYLKREWNYINENDPRPDVPISEKIWKNLPHRIEKKKLTVPQQKNEYDCGLFVLYFMERFIEEAPERLIKKDLAMFGSKWFKPEDASGLRKRIRDLLIEEFENSRLENGRTESPESSSHSPDNDAEQCDEL